MTFFLNIISYESFTAFKYVSKIKIMGCEGELVIYPHHSHLLTCFKPGLLYIVDNYAKKQYMYVSKGILEVKPSIVTVLVDVAMSGTTINKENLLRKQKEIENKIKNNIHENEIIKFKETLSQIIAKLYVLEAMEKSRLKN